MLLLDEALTKLSNCLIESIKLEVDKTSKIDEVTKSTTSLQNKYEI